MTRRIGWACVLVVAAAVLAQPLLAPHDPLAVEPANAFQRPGAAHPLGTDGIGRDVFARLAAGAWSSVLTAVVALALSSAIGLAAGALAGIGRGAVDRAVTGAIDVLLAFPRFVLLLNLAAVFRIDSTLFVGVLIGLTSWMRTARLVRTEMLSMRERAFVEAAHAAGAGRARLLSLHLAPQVLGLVAESAGLRFASVVLTAASLDFLGVGLPADSPTWGRLIRDGQAYLGSAPWIALPAVAALCLLSAGLVLAGERRAARTLAFEGGS